MCSEEMPSIKKTIKTIIPSFFPFNSISIVKNALRQCQFKDFHMSSFSNCNTALHVKPLPFLAHSYQAETNDITRDYVDADVHSNQSQTVHLMPLKNTRLTSLFKVKTHAFNGTSYKGFLDKEVEGYCRDIYMSKTNGPAEKFRRE